MWQPDEIVVAKEVIDEPVTRRIIERCPGIPVRIAETSMPCDIKGASQILSRTAGLVEKIAAGKHVLVLVPTTNNVVGEFEMAETRRPQRHQDNADVLPLRPGRRPGEGAAGAVGNPESEPD